MLVRFYNAVSQNEVDTIGEIPFEVMQVLAGISYRHMVEPFILADIKGGMNSRQIESKYGIARSSIRRIAQNYKLKVG